MIELLNDNMLADLTEAELIQVRALIDRYIKDNKTKVQTKVEHLFKSTIEKLQTEFNAYLKNNGIEHGYKISINLDSEEAIKIKYTMIKQQEKKQEEPARDDIPNAIASTIQEPIVVERFDGKYIQPPTAEQLNNVFHANELDDIFKEED